VITPLRLPPGVYRNGTEYQSKGRWYAANLVRFRNGTIQPIGGWTAWSSNTFTGKCRGLIAWRDNSGNVWVVQGSASKLQVYDDATTPAVKDITPGSLSAGTEDATSSAPADTWSLDTWGEYLVGCLTSDGRLVEWQLGFAGPTVAAAISGAPTSCQGLVVTADRILMALGASGNPRKVAWSDQEDNTTWTAAATNQAGDFELATPGKIVCGKRVRGQTLVVTTVDAWVATYVGQPFVYSWEKAGDGCGIVAANSLVVTDGFAVWLGNRGFYVYDGTVRPLPCEVMDFILSDWSDSQKSKVYGWHNADYGEVWWHYESSGGTEPDRYVVWNYVENHWSLGTMARTAGIGRGVYDYPILAGSDGKLYKHEQSGFLFSSSNPYLESGVLEIGDGERVASINYIWPDESTLGSVTTTFKHRMYPTSTESSAGPYTAALPTATRFTGRQFRLRVDGTEGSDFRLGVPRLDVVVGGKR